MIHSTPPVADARAEARSFVSAEYLFPALLALFGVVFALGMPPFQTPDEDSHFFRAYQVSRGRLLPRMIDGWGGGLVPSSLMRVHQTFLHLAFRPEEQTSWKEFAPYLDAPLAPEAREPRAFPGSAYYSFVPYLPQALGVAVARGLGGGPLAVFYACRLVNLAFCVLLLHLALRVTPVFKLVFGAVALIPVTVQQLSSSSPDASTIGVAFLFTAFLFRLVFVERASAGGRGAIAALLLLAGWLTLCKFPYATLSLLYLAVPPRRFGCWRRYLLVGAGLAAVTLSLTVFMAGLKKYTPDRIIGPGNQASISGQMAEIRAHPLRFAHVCAATIAEHGSIWFEQLGYLGWLDTKVNPLAMHLLLVSLVLLGLADHADPFCPSWGLKAMAMVAAGLCTLVILFCCYVAGCTIGATLIIGPQGRYWVPVLPLLLLPLYNRSVRVRSHQQMLLYLSAAVSSAVLVVAAAGFVRRYYLAPELNSFGLLASLGAAALLIILVSLVGGHRYSAAASGQGDLPSPDSGPRVTVERPYPSSPGSRPPLVISRNSTVA
jgi:uncharacterized membrane protein